MAPSPAPWAVLGDVLWCLGLGCLLGAARDAVRLALGEGPVRCFFRDIAVFAAAAVAAVIRKKAENMQRLQWIIQTFV